MLLMRGGPLLARMPLADLRSLGSLGEPAYLAYRRIVAALEALGAADCARYFARPEPDGRGDVLSWHAAVEGPVRPWSGLSPEERQAAALSIAAVRDRLAGLCASREAVQPGDGFARLLRQAAVSPGLEHLYLVGGQPVLTGWGFEAEGARFDTLAFAAPAAGEGLAPVVPARRRRDIDLPGWWWLPLALLLLLALGWTAWSWPPQAPAARLGGEPSPLSAASPGESATDGHPPSRAAPVAPVPEAPPGASNKTPLRTGEVLSIPERGVEFLEGAWRTESALVDRRDGKPLVQTFTFDRNGWGEVVTRRSDGVECRGRARARRASQGGLLIYGIEPSRCTDGDAFVPFRLECAPGVGGVSDCRGINSDDRSGYGVVVRRL
jgi:hypothetical protein